jgi:UDP-N-acetylmuramoylalanine--D-glutamate ligase
MLAGLQKNSDKMRKVMVIGAAGARIADALVKSDFNNFILSSASDMESVVREATDLARPGDAVVLSPGFPSFDMFKNFQDRGEQFNKAVDAL